MKYQFNFLITVLALVLFGACNSNHRHHDFQDLEEGVFLENSTGFIIADDGGGIPPQVPNSITSLDEGGCGHWFVFIRADDLDAIVFKFYNCRPSVPFTVLFDNGRRIVVNETVTPQDEYYCIIINQWEANYRELYDGLMSSKECQVTDTITNQQIVFRVGGFEKLMKYLK